MWGDIYGCSIVARYHTTEREDGDPEGRGVIQSPLLTPGMKGGGSGKVVGEVVERGQWGK